MSRNFGLNWKIGLGAVSAVCLAACGFLIWVMVAQGLARAGLWAGPLGALAGIVAAWAAVLVLWPRKPKALLPPKLPEVPDWTVARPGELDQVVKALAEGRDQPEGIAVGLYGTGGFGKTTLVQLVCHDRRVRKQFGAFIYPPVTIGPNVRGPAAITAKVNQVIDLVGGEAAGKDTTSVNPRVAGRRLGSLLEEGPRKLLVLDDVWERDQLEPFLVGGKGCAWLVTTRNPELARELTAPVAVDHMSVAQARELLTSGLPDLDSAVVDGLLEVTGRWPLLLRLVNKILTNYAGLAAAGKISAQGMELVRRLRESGPAVVDEVGGQAGRDLDVGQPEERQLAVRATIEASTSLLDPQQRNRLAELGVFAGNETIPFDLVARLWRVTAGVDELQAAQVFTRLADLALVSRDGGSAGGISMHDVIRDFLRVELGTQALAGLNDRLLAALSAELPAAGRLGAEAGGPAGVAWWELGDGDRYMWDHLIEHLLHAGRAEEADAVAGDLRWAGARLERSGPSAPAADLAAAGTPRAGRLRNALERSAHLLAPTEPPGAVVDVLYSRVAADPDWGPQVTALRELVRRPRLVNRWPLPDLAASAVRRILTGHARSVVALAVAPDGGWLASAGHDRTIRIWDVATGRERAILTRHTDLVWAAAVAPDGGWLASASDDGSVRIWDAASWQERIVLTGHDSGVWALAVAPDGSWLASGDRDGSVRIWAVATWRHHATLACGTSGPATMAVAPDGSWLATHGHDGSVRMWSTAAWDEQAPLTGPGIGGPLAVSPDGSWLAFTRPPNKVRILEAATGRERATLDGDAHGVEALAAAPDGSWLAYGGYNQVVRIWEAATGQERASLSGHTGRVRALAAAPDGSWLASGGDDQTIRIWDVGTAWEQAGRGGGGTRSADVWAVAAAPDGTWLASGGRGGKIQIWDVPTGRERTALTVYADTALAIAVAPDSTWLASANWDGRIYVWDFATQQLGPVLHDHPTGGLGRRSYALAAAPDGTWLAADGEDGSVEIWDAATWQLRTTLSGHGATWAMVAPPDGGWFASAGTDGTIRIRDVASWQERTVLTSRQGTVSALAAAPDGSWLASAGTDGTVRIWDVATGRERATLPSQGNEVQAVAIAQDGRWLASASDVTIRIWNVATGQTGALMRVDARTKACAWLGSHVLAVGGSAGLYLFDFLAD